ncbi:histidine phosphatase family protein [Longispora albida]|uniref:histidine phosphatase family protein n=1 Tax=Longispora albida TaxID=203523 RepID=UPI0003682B0C|nr:histidine phosphatase family protein [Longispora albida]
MSSGTETIVHVVRHGEVHNPEKILYGRRPGYYLSDLGVRMAGAVADFLAPRDLTYIVSSPLERAVQTAEPIAAKFGMDVDIDDRLLESTNYFEGMRVSVGDGALRSPRHWPVLWNPFKPSWGEPYLEIAHRMFDALLAAREAAEGHEAAVVSHQLPIWTLRRYAQKERLWHDPRKRECSLASVTSFRFAGSSLIGVKYAEPAGHLIKLSPTAKDAKGA